jgi:hypothetical protein
MATADYSFVASGGIRISGPRHYKLDTCYEMSGGMTIGGSAVVQYNSTSYAYTMTGGITVSGPNDNIVDYDYEMVMTGPLVTIGGSADVSLGLAHFTHTMTGGFHMSGSYTGRADYVYIASGGVTMGGNSGSHDTIPEIFIDLATSWVVQADVVVDLQIGWNTGQSIFYYFRVEGVCLPYGCPPINDQSESEQPCSFSFVQNVIADSVCEVCAQLKSNGFIRTIKTIKKFSVPARRSDQAILEAQGIPQDCNLLEEIPFCQCIECALFCDYENVTINPIGSTIRVDQQFTPGHIYYFANGVLIRVDPSDDGECYIIYEFGDPRNPYYETWKYPCPNTTRTITATAPNWDVSTIGRVRIGGQAIVSWKPNVIDLAPDEKLIKTACDCNDLPSKIWMRQNFNQTNKFKDFLSRNAFTYPDNQPLYYNANNQSWLSNLNLSGLSRDGVTTEVWTVILEWACTTQIGGQDLGAAFWKFGAYFNVRNVEHNTSTNTRVLMTFSRLGPCINGDVDFTIQLNTTTSQGDSDPRHQVENALLIDNIGLFKSATWTKHPKIIVKVSDRQQPAPPTKIIIGPYAPTNEIVRKS